MNAGETARLLGVARELGAEFASSAAEYDRTGAFPHANVQRLRQAGLTGLVTPRRYGGHEAGLELALGVVNAIAKGEASTGLILAQQYLFHVQLRSGSRWPDGLRERVSVASVEHGALVNAFRVERELGTPIRGGLPATTARKVAGGWRVSGHKIYSTGAPGLTWAIVWSRTDEEDPRVGQILVPMDAPGLRIEETWDHLGMRASGSHDVVLEDVFVPDDHAVDIRLPAAWAEKDDAMAGWVALMFATVYDAVARAARDWFIRFLHDRKPSNLGAALASLPHMQAAVGEIDALLLTNRVLFGLAARVDAGVPLPAHELFLAKHTINANSIAAVEKALALAGNPGLTRVNPLERHLRDVLCGRVHSPQSDTVLGTAGRVALGLA
jgi:alkylation response protein AidB-like acyl-CoA dehydrogenase